MTDLTAPRLRNFCFYWLPPLAATGGILLLSGDLGSSVHTKDLLNWLLAWLPFLGETAGESNGYLRKAGHVTAYAVLYLLWFRALRPRFAARPGAALLWPLLLCLAVSLADEGHQALEPSRTGCLSDVALDFGAAALAALALWCKRIYLYF